MNALPSAARYARSNGSAQPPPTNLDGRLSRKERRRSLSRSSNDSSSNHQPNRIHSPLSSDDEHDELPRSSAQQSNVNDSANAGLLRPSTGFRFGESNLRTKVSHDSSSSSSGFARYSAERSAFSGLLNVNASGVSATSNGLQPGTQSVAGRQDTKQVTSETGRMPILPTKLRIVGTSNLFASTSGSSTQPKARETIVDSENQVASSSSSPCGSTGIGLPQGHSSASREQLQRRAERNEDFQACSSLQKAASDQDTSIRQISSGMSGSSLSEGPQKGARGTLTYDDSQLKEWLPPSAIAALKGDGQDISITREEASKISNYILSKSGLVGVAANIEDVETCSQTQASQRSKGFGSAHSEDGPISSASELVETAKDAEIDSATGDPARIAQSTSPTQAKDSDTPPSSSTGQHSVASVQGISVSTAVTHATTLDVEGSGRDVQSSTIEPTVVEHSHSEPEKQKHKRQSGKKPRDKPKKRRGEWRVENYNKTETHSGAPGYYYSGPHIPAFQVSLSGSPAGYPMHIDTNPPTCAPGPSNSLSGSPYAVHSRSNQISSPASSDGTRTISSDHTASAPGSRQLFSGQTIPETTSPIPLTPSAIDSSAPRSSSTWPDNIAMDFDISMNDTPGDDGPMDFESALQPPTSRATPQGPRRGKLQDYVNKSPTAIDVRIANAPRKLAPRPIRKYRVLEFPKKLPDTGDDIHPSSYSSLPSRAEELQRNKDKTGSAAMVQQAASTLMNMSALPKTRGIELTEVVNQTNPNPLPEAHDPSQPRGTGTSDPKSRSQQLVTAIIEDTRPVEVDESLAELSLPLKELQQAGGWSADAQHICSTLQSGPSRIDGPAKVYTLRGRFKQYILRVLADNTDNYVPANVHIHPDLLLHLIIEPLNAPLPQPTAPTSNAASVSRTKRVRPTRAGKDSPKQLASASGPMTPGPSFNGGARNASLHIDEAADDSDDQTPVIPSKRRGH